MTANNNEEVKKRLKEKINKHRIRETIERRIDLNTLAATLAIDEEMDDELDDILDKIIEETTSDVDKVTIYPTNKFSRHPSNYIDIMANVFESVFNERVDKRVFESSFIAWDRIPIPYTIDLYRDEVMLTNLLRLTMKDIVQLALILLYYAIFRYSNNRTLADLAARLFVKRLALYTAYRKSLDDPNMSMERAITSYLMLLKAIMYGDEEIKELKDIGAIVMLSNAAIATKVLKLFESVEDVLNDMDHRYAIAMIFLPIAIARYCKALGTGGIDRCLNVLRHDAYDKVKLAIEENMKKLLGDNYRQIISDDLIKKLIELIKSELGTRYIITAFEEIMQEEP